MDTTNLNAYVGDNPVVHCTLASIGVEVLLMGNNYAKKAREKHRICRLKHTVFTTHLQCLSYYSTCSNKSIT